MSKTVYKYPAIYMDDSDCNYTKLILDGVKTVETRSRPTLDRFIRRRVGLLVKQKRRRYLVGFVDIKDKIFYNNIEEFIRDRYKHHVPPNSKYWIKTKKVGYTLCNPYWLATPILIDKDLFVKGDYQALDLKYNYAKEVR